MENQKKPPENTASGKNTVNPNAMKWLMKFAGGRKGQFGLSVFCALIGVAASLIPYFIIADIVKNLIDGNKAADFYWNKCLLIGLFWILRYVFHSISTTLSHHATFNVLADIRKALLAKIASLPLGTVSAGTVFRIL